MKEADIKKAIEIHINRGDCKECAYANLPIGACETQMLKDALDLINHYTTEAKK